MLKQKFDSVPWTTTQTFNGIFLTLIPWIAFTAVSSLFSTSATGQATKPLNPQADIANAVVSLIFSLIIYSAFLLAPLFYARRYSQADGADQRSVWQLLGFRRCNVGLALLLVLGSLVLIIVLNQAYSYLITTFHLPLQTNDQLVLQRAKTAPITTYVSLFIAVVVAPFCEEIFFRSFSFMGLKNGMSPVIAVILSALIFGAAHGDPASLPVLFFIGIALAILRLMTGSYWPGYFLHFLNNALSALLIILAVHGIHI